jgi:uncharacterized membrane protein
VVTLGGKPVPAPATKRKRWKGFAVGRLGSAWERLRSSFWFVPALMLAGAGALFVVTLQLDQALRASLSGLPLVFSGGPTAARSVLSAISGSLITVAATVFSLTIVALQLASSQYSPRVMRSFTSDTGVQVVLGAYIATFLYSLLALRVVRSPEGGVPAFVPVISVTTAVVLTLVCVGLLVYFIQHIATIIQSSTIVERAQEDALRSISNLDDLDGSRTPEEELEDRFRLETSLGGAPAVVRTKESGYAQYIDVDAVLEAVAALGAPAAVEVPFGPGHFAAAGFPIAKVWPAPEGGLGPEVLEGVQEAFYFGRERSFRQDFAFGLRQLSDIALKGLSPGVNDPTTAMQAMDRMEAILAALASKALPQRVRERRIGGSTVLLKVGHYGFDDVVGLAFDQIRRAAFTSGQVAVLERLLEILDRLAEENELPGRRDALWQRAFAVARLAPGQVSDPYDAANLVCSAVRVASHLLKTERSEAVDEDLETLLDASEGLPGEQRIREAVEAARRVAGP